ncbi:hypothetical protein AVEN_114582-1 [Araneus ventricosus]|uniref:Uncharacterized protein n=1 Tax=Araneus ventricosus TaxID=182803 RepID=A0A4Y2RWV9_ARAVE|nr:hypothetical protein AVEN_114582-1 [Araneus ventricosus]
MKKKELLSFTHSTLIHRLFRNSVVEKTSSRFLEHSSLWSFKLPLFRKTNQKQKNIFSFRLKNTKNIDGKIEAEARQDKTPGPTGPGARSWNNTNHSLTPSQKNSKSNGKRFQIQTPKTS